MFWQKRGKPIEIITPDQIEEKPEVTLDLNPKVPALQRFPDKTLINVRYMIIAPYVSAHIYWNDEIGEVMYDLEEPILDEAEKQQLARLEEGMRELINVNFLVENSIEGIITYLDKTAKLLITELGLKISKESFKKRFLILVTSKICHASTRFPTRSRVKSKCITLMMVILRQKGMR